MTGTAYELLDLCLISVTNLSLRLYLQGCFSPSFFFLTQSPGADISIFRYCCYVLQIADHLAAALPEGACSGGHEARILLGKSDIPAHVDFYVLKISAMPDKTLTNSCKDDAIVRTLVLLHRLLTCHVRHCYSTPQAYQPRWWPRRDFLRSASDTVSR